MKFYTFQNSFHQIEMSLNELILQIDLYHDKYVLCTSFNHDMLLGRSTVIEKLHCKYTDSVINVCKYKDFRDKLLDMGEMKLEELGIYRLEENNSILCHRRDYTGHTSMYYTNALKIIKTYNTYNLKDIINQIRNEEIKQFFIKGLKEV